MSIIVEDNKRLKTELIGEGVVGCDNADFRQEYRRIDKILCSLLIRNCSGSDTLSDAELQQLGIEVGSLDLQTGAASSAAHHFFPNYEIPRIQESSIPTGKLIADGKWLREWLTSLTETFSGFGDPVRVHTSHLFPTTLRNSMDSYLRAFDKDFSEEFFDGCISRYDWTINFSSAKADSDTDKPWKYKNSTGRHIYNHKIEFPFRLLSPEIVKKVVITTHRDIEAEFFLKASLGDALVEFMSGKPIHLSRISHGMCSIHLQTGCGSDDRLSAGELSALAWQIKNAIFAEMELCQRLFPDEVLKLKKLNYPRLAIIYDLSGKVRVLYAYLADKLYVQASKILDFGWLAVKQPVETNTFEEGFDAKKYLDMMGILLRWMWPITKENPTGNTEDLGLDWPW